MKIGIKGILACFGAYFHSKSYIISNPRQFSSSTYYKRLAKKIKNYFNFWFFNEFCGRYIFRWLGLSIAKPNLQMVISTIIIEEPPVAVCELFILVKNL
jgi:hypothetical protein